MDRKVLDYLKMTHGPEATFLEFGGGAGSLDLHAAFYGFTVEHDYRWYDWLTRKGIQTIYAPLDNGFYMLTKKLQRRVQLAEIVVIDGPPGRLRENAHRIQQFIKPGATVVYDDSHRNYVAKMMQGEVQQIIHSQGRRTTHVCTHPHPTPCPPSQPDKDQQHG